jgi:hypothetical protein
MAARVLAAYAARFDSTQEVAEAVAPTLLGRAVVHVPLAQGRTPFPEEAPGASRPSRYGRDAGAKGGLGPGRYHRDHGGGMRALGPHDPPTS